jgi:tubulin-specific chaperone A
MAPPTVLAIKTSSVIRLVKEEAMYHKELVVEQQRLAKMSEDPESDEYALKQQVYTGLLSRPPQPLLTD